ncbi:hypothetical protein [Candidatus Tremblayella endosymbiont of Pseudococcus viburni]
MTVCRAVGPMIGACMSYDSLRQLRMLRCGTGHERRAAHCTF